MIGGGGGNRTRVCRPFALYMGHLYYDLAQATLNRLAFARGNGLRPHGIAAVALSPGWMRTELVLHAFTADDGDWRQVEALRRAESTPYVGRAVVAPARNGRVMRKSGELCRRAGMRVRPTTPPPFRVPPTAHG